MGSVQDLRTTFGTRLRQLRKTRALTQEELAHRANLHWTYISDLERTRQTPTLDVVNRLARGLDITLADFFAPFNTHYRARSRSPRSDHDRHRSTTRTSR